jgi:hypothetical protein
VSGSCRVFIRSGVEALEEPSTTAEGGRPGLAPVTMAGPRWGIRNETCSVVVLFSEPALEEPFTATEGIY